MRQELIRVRVPAVRLCPLVLVMKVLFWEVYGIYRQLTCPMFGVTAEIIQDSCQEEHKIKRALSVVVTHGPFLFADFGEDYGETLHQRLLLEIADIRRGGGKEIIAAVMSWVWNVQLRAIQDHALEQPAQFEKAWCTRHYCHWSDQSKHWGAALRFREDRDIGWVPSQSTPAWSKGVATLRNNILVHIRDIASVSAMEDESHWRDCGGGSLGGVLYLPAPAHVPTGADV